MSRFNNNETHVEISKQKYSETADKQAKKGMEVYGKSLNFMEAERNWLSMLDEEIIDGHQYLIAEMRKREFILNKIRKLTDNEEIHFWCDELDGKNNGD